MSYGENNKPLMLRKQSQILVLIRIYNLWLKELWNYKIGAIRPLFYIILPQLQHWIKVGKNQHFLSGAEISLIVCCNNRSYLTKLISQELYSFLFFHSKSVCSFQLLSSAAIAA